MPGARHPLRLTRPPGLGLTGPETVVSQSHAANEALPLDIDPSRR
jgi:hypothetical protein